MSRIEASGGLVYWETVLPALVWKIDVKTMMMDDDDDDDIIVSNVISQF